MLSNKYIYSLLIILFVAILTTINNYYFYAHVARENDRGSQRFEAMISNTLKLCKASNIATETCNNSIIRTMDEMSKYAYYTTKATVKNHNNKVIWNKSRNEHDKIAVLNIEIQLPDLKVSDKATIDIENKWNNSNIALSVYRSMTFSLTQTISIAQEKGFDKAYSFLTSVAWYRSRPTIGFTIFSFLLLWIYRRREEEQKLSIENRDRQLVEEFKKNKILTIKVENFEENLKNIFIKLNEYDHIINPPINTLTFDDLISNDTGELGTKFRKTLEKLLYKAFENQFNYKPKTLADAIFKLNDKGFVSDDFKKHANIIRIYGNSDSHYNEQENMSKDEAVILAQYIINIVEELVEKKLCVSEKLTDQIKSTQVKLATGFKIVKKFNEK